MPQSRASHAKARQPDTRKSIGTGIFVQNNLTRFREQLAHEGRQFVRASNLTKTWAAGCNVYGAIKIHSMDEAKISIKYLDTIELINEGRIPSNLTVA